MRVTVEFFKQTGKWYTTEHIEWRTNPLSDTPSNNFKYSIQRALGLRLDLMYALAMNNPEGIPLMLMPNDHLEATHDTAGIVGKMTRLVLGNEPVPETLIA